MYHQQNFYTLILFRQVDRLSKSEIKEVLIQILVERQNWFFSIFIFLWTPMPTIVSIVGTRPSTVSTCNFEIFLCIFPKILSPKPFCNSFGNSYVRFLVTHINFRFTCGEWNVCYQSGNLHIAHLDFRQSYSRVSMLTAA